MPEDASKVLNARYRLLDVVGEGGMAVVWRAEDVLLGRTVAIKVLRDQYAADPDFVERFRSEARAAAALNDPGVVGVYDVGEDGGRYFLVLEYVPGTDLKTLIRDEAPLAPERAVRIGATLAQAVSAAHAIGLVHRDIKPQNVLVTPDGRMKVADFGIARAVSAIGSTAPGIVLGTVHYLSPEQATGAPATFASDVYALGVVLYEMLTGRVPFEADSAVGVAMRIAHETPQPLASLNPRVPAVLVGIVDRAMARDPSARYPDARALAEALEGYARWSDQATLGVQPALAAAPAAGLPAGAPPRSAPARAPGGPLLDWTGLTLGLVALAAIAGLVPLWMALALQSGGPGPAGASLTPAPTPTGVASPTPEPAGLLPGVDLGTTVTVPGVVGMAVAEASRLLEGQSLGATTEFTASQGVAEGLVVGQEPVAGSSVPAGTVLRLVVSGRSMVVVPELAGDYGAAADQLVRLGLVARRAERWGGGGAPVGAVLGYEPPPGTRLAQGSPVDVVVNSGAWLPLGVDFADHIHLGGVSLDRDVARPGEPLDVVARWEVVDTVTGDYLARVALVDGSGQAVATAEHTPGGDRPTNAWQPGEVFDGDHYTLQIPPEAAPGPYTLVVELVSRADAGQRLEIVRSAFARQDGPRVILREVTLQTP